MSGYISSFQWSEGEVKKTRSRGRQDLFLTTGQAAQLLRVSASRVRQFVSVGRLHAIKKGRDLLIPIDEVSRFSRLPRKRTGRPNK